MVVWLTSKAPTLSSATSEQYHQLAWPAKPSYVALSPTFILSNINRLKRAKNKYSNKKITNTAACSAYMDLLAGLDSGLLPHFLYRIGSWAKSEEKKKKIDKN